MPRKNRPNKPIVQTVAPAVLQGDVFATFVAEAGRIGAEVAARREFDEDVGEYLKLKNLVDDFEAWRKAKHAPPAATSK